MWRWKNRDFVKGLAVGALALLVLAVLVVAVPNLFVMHKRSPIRESTGLSTYSDSRYLPAAGGGGGGSAAKLVGEEAEQTVYADGPKIIRTGQVDLIVENVNDSRQKIEALAVAEKGYVQSERVEGDTAKLTIKVPSTRFEAVREQLRKLAKRVRTDASTATDVSKQYIDTDARLRNYRAEETQFLDILKHARTVADTLAATKELSEVREHIEETDAELQHLKDQIDLSAIEISISSDETPSYAVHWSISDSVRSAWQSCRQGLADFADFVLWLLLYLPVLILWIVVIFGIVMVAWLLVRRIVVPIWKRVFRRPAVAPSRPS